VGAQCFNAVLVALGAVGRASAIAVLGNENGLPGKRRAGLPDAKPAPPEIAEPRFRIFIYFDEVHQSGYVPFRCSIKEFEA